MNALAVRCANAPLNQTVVVVAGLTNSKTEPNLSLHLLC